MIVSTAFSFSRLMHDPITDKKPEAKRYGISASGCLFDLVRTGSSEG
jgi:hypothetical protein